jgi:hypothetical protein
VRGTSALAYKLCNALVRYDASAFTGTGAAAAAATESPLEVVMFSKIECKLFPDECVAPIPQGFIVTLCAGTLWWPRWCKRFVWLAPALPWV